MRLLAPAALAALTLAGCGEDRIDTARAEGEIARAIEQQTGLAVAEVECPKDVTIEAGARFRCTVRGENGGTAPVDVLQTDDEGNIRFNAPDLEALRPDAASGAGE